MAGAIRAIDASSVHQITSGQVITDLSTAVKELVENSLDAGATNIDVRFKEYGTTSFEVVDNGSGIEQENHATVALKSHTSKLASYDDLLDVASFGFRGEALSSLCQLADVTIITATAATAPMGSVLTFDRRGQLLSSSGKVARPKGTTVQVSNLFGSVPVRRKEFERNSKKQFNNATTLIQAYGLISEGVRLSVTNQLAKKPVQSMFKTDGKNVRENYAILFTAKAALTLMDFDITLDVEAEKRVLKLAGVADLTTQVRVTGLISKPVAGSGRTSSDRQFFFINGRPVETKAISKAFNEVYKGYLPNHLPSIVADFQLPTSSYDVNVSPDKRSIFLHSERNLVDALKTALDALFQPYRSTYAADGANLTRTGRLGTAVAPQNGLQAKIEAQTQARTRQSSERSGSISAGSSRPQTPREGDDEGNGLIERSRSRTVDSAAIDEDTPQLEEEATDAGIEEPGQGDQSDLDVHEDGPVGAAADTAMSLSPASSLYSQRDQDGPQFTAAEVSSPSPEPENDYNSTGLPAPKGKSLQMTLDTRGASWNLQIGSSRSVEHGATRKKARTAADPSTSNQLLDRNHFRTLAAAGTPALPAATAQSAIELEDNEDDDEIELEQDEEDNEEEAEMDEQEGDEIEAATLMHTGRMAASTELGDRLSEAEEYDAPGGPAIPGRSRQQTARTDASSGVLDESIMSQTEAETPTVVRTDNRKEPANESEGSVQIDMARLRRRVEARSKSGKGSPRAHDGEHAQGDDKDEDLEAAGISHNAQQAEQALSRLVSKADFAEMEIVGQFNLAFIIARRRHAKGKARETGGHDDLMIIDQHASDEKYNFERLQLVTKIDSQRLIRPRELNLTASDELLAIEHEDVLRFNGFEIEVEEDAPSGQRIKLVAMPVAKATKKTEFTIDDLEELLFLLRDHTGSGMLRPSKTRKLFAMLACRSSVMVGRVLNTSQMTSIVRHMGTMDQPWNCPHGRNTMRWLKNLQTPPRNSRFCIEAASWARLRRGE